MKKIKIYIIVTFPVILEGLMNFLKGCDYEIECFNLNVLSETKYILVNKNPDLIIIDDSFCSDEHIMSFFNQIETLTQIRNIIILTGSLDSKYIVELLNLGIKGLVHKKSDKYQLLEAIDITSSGGIFIDSFFNYLKYKKHIFMTLNGVTQLKQLSKREMEILELIAEGYHNQEIANEINLSIKTIENYKEKIKSKLGYKSIHQLYDILRKF